MSWFRCVVQTSQRRSASRWHAGGAPGTGSLSSSRAERQGSWGTGNKDGQCPGTRPYNPFLTLYGASQLMLCPLHNLYLINKPQMVLSACTQQENNYQSLIVRPMVPSTTARLLPLPSLCSFTANKADACSPITKLQAAAQAMCSGGRQQDQDTPVPGQGLSTVVPQRPS